MRFFTTLACTFVASISLVSAAHIHGRNALRMAKGLPPLPPRMTTRTDTARRDVPSGVSTPLFENGGFETGSGSPWILDEGAYRIEDPKRCRSGNYCGLLTVPPALSPTGFAAITYRMSLTPRTDYTVIFYDYFIKVDISGCTSRFTVDHNLQWSSTYTQDSTAYTQHSVTFTTSSDNNHEMVFSLLCPGQDSDGYWFIDDITLALATPSGAIRRK
ncbi:hypothetical protein DL96DRAFT_206606 [Flagelloscypha sp. PMI_526]|nr:hypothetical protein DL96DRAFT_206606 [Flagelloscypha sp. PMI_526]